MNDIPKKKPIWKKWWVWLVVAIIIMTIANMGQDAKTEAETPADAVVDAKEPEQENTIENKAREAIVKAAKDKNNKKKERIIDLRLVDDVITGDGAKIAEVTLNADERATLAYTKDLINEHSAKVFKSLFAIPEVAEVSLLWNLPLIDNGGNENSTNVLRIRLKRETADKINWDKFIGTNFPKIADQYWEHNAVKE